MVIIFLSELLRVSSMSYKNQSGINFLNGQLVKPLRKLNRPLRTHILKTNKAQETLSLPA